jgi:hypothetical protein
MGLCRSPGRGHDLGAVRVKGRFRLEWLARRVATTQRDAACAAVVLDGDDEFVTGLAAVDGAGILELAAHVGDDPRWLGEPVRVVYIERRADPRPTLSDLARWHDLVVRHAEHSVSLVDWMLVDERRGRVHSMARRFGGPRPVQRV